MDKGEPKIFHSVLSPACGRDYKSVAAVKADWLDNQYFILEDLGDWYCGQPVNRPQFACGWIVNIRYDNLSKVVILKA